MNNLDLKDLIERLSPDQARELGRWMQENGIAHPKKYVISPLSCWEITRGATESGTLVLVSGSLATVLGEIVLRVSRDEQEKIRNKVYEMIGER